MPELQPQVKKELTPQQLADYKRGIKLGITVRTCTFTCNNCGNTWKESFGPIAWLKFKLFGTTCPNCHKKNYNYKTAITVISVAVAIALASLGAYLFM
jgi:Zn finger protein HypA/HybF involved in hydrogenase expression